jgi:hypothetical protein
LSALRYPTSAAYLRQIAREGSAEMRTQAALSVGNLGEASSLPMLVDLFEESKSSPRLQTASIVAMGKPMQAAMRERRDLARVMQANEVALGTSRESLRLAAAANLVAMGSSLPAASKAPLLRALAISIVSPARAKPALPFASKVELLPSGEVATDASVLAGVSGGERAAVLLREFTKEQAGKDRAKDLPVLQTIRTELASVIRANLRSGEPDAGLSLLADSGLGPLKLGNDETIRALRREHEVELLLFAERGGAEHRALALRALRFAESKKSDPLLLGLLKESDPERVESALNSLFDHVDDRQPLSYPIEGSGAPSVTAANPPSASGVAAASASVSASPLAFSHRIPRTAYQVATQPSADVMSAVIEVARKHAVWSVRYRAVLVLGAHSSGRSAAHALATIAKKDGYQLVREQALVQLASIDLAAAKVVAQDLSKDPEVDVSKRLLQDLLARSGARWSAAESSGTGPRP